MKRINNIIKASSLSVLLSVALASCNDYLTVYPQDKITEETFWEDKRDLEGVRYATYKQLASQVEKMIIWGDLRSDAYRQNTVISSDQGNRNLYRNIIQADIDTTWAIYDWSGMYSVIGYCNKVLQHGSDVLEKDKQFTAAEWKQMKAEMITMRALSYFYLVRAFKNVPYTTKVVTSDTEVEYFQQMPALTIIDELIKDVKNVENQARNRFTNTQDTKGLITNGTINCLLADMYLWRASMTESGYEDVKSAKTKLETKLTKNETDSINKYTTALDEERAKPEDQQDAQKIERYNKRLEEIRAEIEVLKSDIAALDESMTKQDPVPFYNSSIEYADKAICKLGDQFDEELKSSPMASRDGYISWVNAPTFGRSTGLDFMLKNTVDEAHHGNVQMKAYNDIFGSQNSYESFFELQFNSTDARKNTIVNSFWGYNQSAHLVSSYSEDNRQDMRHWFSAWKNIDGVKNSQDWYCLKWMHARPVFSENIGKADAKIEMSVSSDDYNNWIVYRLSDALLIEAEAAACLGELGWNKAANEELCKKILRMVNRRWYVDVQNGGEIEYDLSKDFSRDPLKSYETNFYTDNWVTNVMKTRKIEFLGEGKRWFDLIRWAERNNEGAVKHESDASKDEDPGMVKMYNTFMNGITGYETARNRCVNMWGLYCPIYYMEIKAYRAAHAQDKISQNPIWNKSKYDR